MRSKRMTKRGNKLLFMKRMKSGFNMIWKSLIRDILIFQKMERKCFIMEGLLPCVKLPPHLPQLLQSGGRLWSTCRSDSESASKMSLAPDTQTWQKKAPHFHCVCTQRVACNSMAF